MCGIIACVSSDNCDNILFEGLIQLKNTLQPSDIVVCIFHDHGSRYVGKVYNDDWMKSKGFL
jgi:cystathionine beta-synthase